MGGIITTSRSCRVSLIAKLIDKNPNKIETLIFDKKTPLMYFCKYNEKESAELVLKSGYGFPDKTIKKNRTALFYACKYNADENLILRLFEATENLVNKSEIMAWLVYNDRKKLAYIFSKHELGDFYIYNRYIDLQFTTFIGLVQRGWFDLADRIKGCKILIASIRPCIDAYVVACTGKRYDLALKLIKNSKIISLDDFAGVYERDVGISDIGIKSYIQILVCKIRCKEYVNAYIARGIHVRDVSYGYVFYDPKKEIVYATDNRQEICCIAKKLQQNLDIMLKVDPHVSYEKKLRHLFDIVRI
jgi:hypothetical protein